MIFSLDMKESEYWRITNHTWLCRGNLPNSHLNSMIPNFDEENVKGRETTGMQKKTQCGLAKGRPCKIKSDIELPQIK